MVCLVECILGRMKKKRWENDEGKLFGGFLVERGEGKMMVGPTKKFSPLEWGENLVGDLISEG